MTKPLLVCLVLYFCSSLLYGPILAFESYDRHQLLRVTPHTTSQLRLLQNVKRRRHLPLQFWDEPVQEKKSVSVQVPPEYVDVLTALLKSGGVYYKVVLSDIQQTLRKQLDSNAGHRERDASKIQFDKYHKFDEITAWLRAIANRHRQVTELIQIGSSYEGRPLLVMKISTPSNKSKKAIWLDAGIHAREWIAPATLIYFIGYILENLEKDQDLSTILDGLDLYILPVVNADGYVYSWNHDRLWRKTRSPNNGSSCIGTDTNRNFNFHWSEIESFFGIDPCDQTYPGMYPFSESEAAAMANFLSSQKDTVVGYITYHNFGEIMAFPYGHTPELMPEYEEMMALSANATAALGKLYNTKYLYGSLWDTVGPNSGSSVDYMYGVLGIKYTFGIELRDHGDFYFLQPANQIVPNAKESWEAFKEIAFHIIEDNK